jgi:hypothetical protein
VDPLVKGTMHYVIEALLGVVTSKFTNNRGSRDRLHETAAAAHAWIETFLDLKEVEACSLSPDDVK